MIRNIILGGFSVLNDFRFFGFDGNSGRLDPNVSLALTNCRLLLVNPATSTELERSFSAARRPENVASRNNGAMGV